MPWKERGDEITQQQVDRLGQRERQFHWAIAAGLVAMKDIARFIRVSAEWVTKLRRTSERRLSKTRILVEDRRQSRAQELADEGLSHVRIAEELGYSIQGDRRDRNASGVTTTLRRQRKKWEKFD